MTQTNRMASSFDYEDIKAALQLFMKNSPAFKDVNWDGAAANSLLRVLAYNTELQQISNNFLFNELNQDTAVVRANVAAQASSMQGYLPQGKRAATFLCNVEVIPTGGAPYPEKAIIDRSVKFFAAKDGVALDFVADTEYEAFLENGSYRFQNVRLVQGTWATNAFIVQSNESIESYTIPNVDVDISTLTVAVKPSVSSGLVTAYKRFNSVFDLGADSLVYFMRVNRKENYVVEFGDDRLSRRLKFGEIVLMDYVVTDGEAGNGVSNIVPVGAVAGFFNVKIEKLQDASSGGQEPETIESIRRIAPLSFSAQGNAITPSDFVALTKQLYPEADSVASWGGEENDPPKYGYQIVAVKPKGSSGLSQAQKQFLHDLLAPRCVGSITPIIVDPEYTYLNITTEILYQRDKTVLSEQSLKVKIYDAIKLFSREELEFFDADFIYSKLVSFINAIDDSIVGNVTTATYSKKFKPELNAIGSYDFKFETPIVPGSVKFSNFSILDQDYDGWTYWMVDVDGGIVIKKSKPGVADYVFPGVVGSVNYATGNIKLSKFRPISAVGGFVNLDVTPSKTDPSLFNGRSSVLQIDKINIKVEKRGL